MGKQRAPLEFNRLAGGIITEASPLTFPDNASIDELNFELRSDGTRHRRLGMDFESNGEFNIAGGTYQFGEPFMVHTYLWENVSGRNELAYAVLQIDNKIYFYRTDRDTLSTGLIQFTVELPSAGYKKNPYDFSSLDGTLVIVTGGVDIITISVDVSNEALPVFTKDVGRLTTRDLFGIPVWYNRAVETGSSVEDLIDITDPFFYAKRPLVSGLPTAEVLGQAVQFISGDYQVSSNFVVAFNFSTASYLGFTLDTFSSQESKGTMGIRFSGATPTFETIGFFSNTLSEDFTLSRSLSDPRSYEVVITPSQYITLVNASGANFILVDNTFGNVYAYNLRNQTFATSRLPKTGTVSQDPIQGFEDEAHRYPSMSDTVLSALYPNVEDSGNKTADRFHAKDLVENPLGTTPAPKGYFIIDALERSASRHDRWEELLIDQGHSLSELTELPVDTTPGGASAITEYGGRLWYGGFSELGSATAQGGTRLESYLLYSQLANNKRVVTRCYQSGDPTSSTDPELLETDGGFLSLDGAYGISKLVPIGNSLLAFAENGVWSVTGLDGNYFSPTSPRVQKITDKGSISPRAVVVIDTSIIYWTKGGIYAIQLSSAGTYEVSNLVDKTIQTLYDEIPYEDKRKAVGSYDSFTNEASWLIYNTTSRTRETEMLVLKTNTGAFTRYEIGDNSTPYTTLVGYSQVPPFTLQDIVDPVTAGGSVVVSGGEVVTTLIEILNDRKFDTKGVVIHSLNGVNEVTFGEFNNESFLDWGETDAGAFMVTGYVSGGDLQRVKQIPYITTHFERTEDGFFLDVNSDLQLKHPSGCLVQAQWDWANSANSGRWGREFQAYRYPRHYMPEDVNDPFDTGFSTITTRNKIRGKGRVLSIKFSSEPLKDCRILGWSSIMGVQDGL